MDPILIVFIVTICLAFAFLVLRSKAKQEKIYSMNEYGENNREDRLKPQPNFLKEGTSKGEIETDVQEEQSPMEVFAPEEDLTELGLEEPRNIFEAAGIPKEEIPEVHEISEEEIISFVDNHFKEEFLEDIEKRKEFEVKVSEES